MYNESFFEQRGKFLGERVIYVAEHSRELGYGRYALKGNLPFTIGYRTQIAYVGCFYLPLSGENRLVVAHYNNPQRPLIDIYNEALGMQIPETVSRLPVSDDPEERRLMVAWAIREIVPIIMLNSGKSVETQEDVVLLYAVAGIAPKTALEELQETVLDYKDKLN